VQFERVNGYLPEEPITGRGFKGKTEVKGVKVSIPKPDNKKASQYQKRRAREKFRKKAWKLKGSLTNLLRHHWLMD
jgi:IS5 family transposase